MLTPRPNETAAWMPGRFGDSIGDVHARTAASTAGSCGAIEAALIDTARASGSTTKVDRVPVAGHQCRRRARAATRSLAGVRSLNKARRAHRVRARRANCALRPQRTSTAGWGAGKANPTKLWSADMRRNPPKSEPHTPSRTARQHIARLCSSAGSVGVERAGRSPSSVGVA